MPHDDDDDRTPPEDEDSRPQRGPAEKPARPRTHESPLTPPPSGPLAVYEPTREATRLKDTNIPTLMDAAFQLNSSIQNLWNTFVGFSGVVVGLLLTAQDKLTGWPRLLACFIYLMFVAVNFSALNKKYSWLGDVLASLRMAGRGLTGAELEDFKNAAGRTYIPGEWLSKHSRDEWRAELDRRRRTPQSWWQKLGRVKIFKCRLGSHGLGFYAYLAIVLAVLAVFLITT